ncbi:MAG: uroporphyrinogen decarboxylase [Spirochaetales bacterium]|nr:MAG: uroporphyrinogen decarboxylase [Spirochaetales bacterium]
MTGRERIKALLGNEQTDRHPFMPVTMMLAGDAIGAKYGIYATDYRVLAEGQIAVAEKFDIDHVSVISDPAVEAHDWGAVICYYDNQPPAVDERAALVSDKAGLLSLKAPDPYAGKRMLNRIRAVELLREKAGGDRLVEGWVEGPAAESADLRGINHLMLDLIDDPEFINDLFGMVTDTAIAFALAQVKAGADIIGVGDAAASLVGPALYEDLVLKYEQRLVDAIHGAGGLVRLHICGNTTDLCRGMGTLGSDIIDLDSLCPLKKARADMGPNQALLGNIDPVRVLRNGKPEDIRRETKACRDAAGQKYIIGAGCEIPRDTPFENIHAMRTFM